MGSIPRTMIQISRLPVFLLVSVSVTGFNVEISSDQLTVIEGDQFYLGCQASSSYEFCRVTSPDGRFCDFEWKRSEWNITLGKCSDLEDRVEFVGNYEEHQCAVNIKDAVNEDQGVWTCALESYVLGGSRGSGYLRIGEFEVGVEIPTTTTTSKSTSPLGRSPRMLEIDSSQASDLELDLASSALPLVVSLVLVVVLLAVISVLVMLHRIREGSVKEVVTKETGGALNTSFEEDKENDGGEEKVMEEVYFMRKVFPHIINFPSEEPALNL